MTKRTGSIFIAVWGLVLFGGHVLASQVFQGRMNGDLSALEKGLEGSAIAAAQREAIHSFMLSATQNVQALSDLNFFLLLFGGMVIATRTLLPSKK